MSKPTQAEIIEGVKRCLADSLAMEPDEIALDASLTRDLQIDSLDLVDILFTLEKTFQVKVRNPQLDALLRGEYAAPETPFIPADDVAKLAAWLPGLAQAPDPARIPAAQLFDYVTVDFLVKLVENGTPRTA